MRSSLFWKCRVGHLVPPAPVPQPSRRPDPAPAPARDSACRLRRSSARGVSITSLRRAPTPQKLTTADRCRLSLLNSSTGLTMRALPDPRQALDKGGIRGITTYEVRGSGVQGTPTHECHHTPFPQPRRRLPPRASPPASPPGCARRISARAPACVLPSPTPGSQPPVRLSSSPAAFPHPPHPHRRRRERAVPRLRVHPGEPRREDEGGGGGERAAGARRGRLPARLFRRPPLAALTPRRRASLVRRQVNDVVNIIVESAQTGEIGDGVPACAATALAALPAPLLPPPASPLRR